MSGLIRSDSGKVGTNGSLDNLTKNKTSSELIEIPLNTNQQEDKKNHFKEKTNNHDTKGHSKNEDDDNNGEENNALTPIAFYSLFRYSTFTDRILIAIGCISGTISGATNPVIIILLGWMLESFVKLENLSAFDRCPTNGTFPNATTTPEEEQAFMDDFVKKCLTFSFAMIGISVGQFILSFLIVFTLSWAAENQSLRIRKEFMRAVLRQDIGWYDTHETGDFASRVTADLIRIQDGIGEKVGICIYFYSTMLISIIVAMFYGWQLTLVILSIMPVLMASSTLIAKIQAKISGNELSAYGKAGAIAEEVLSAIRTVASFNGERKEIVRYSKELLSAKKNGIKRGLLTSIGMAIVWFCIYASYALAFWYGSKMVLESRCTDHEYHSSDLIIVFFCVLTGAMFVGQTAPYMEAFSMAKGAASQVFSIISRVPPIDSSSESGSTPTEFVGHVKFINVKFRYPSREDVQILQGFNLTAIPGETVALVGSSGCGKSTVIQLLQRFYDIDEGQILVGNRNIKEYNVGFLRDNIGVVGQEPILFATSIYENIRYGFPKAKEDDVIRAAKIANAHDFISKLPEGYNTQVGERGTQLSGGQKQRIAIARALIRNPKILLLDEATSALDTESESVVQAALDEARKGRTTLVVAHRLSTIRNADKIVAVEKGRVKEVGTHEELINAKGIYYQLVEAQTTKKLGDEEDETDDEFDDLEEEVERKWAQLRSRHTSITSTVSSKSGDSITQQSLAMPPHLHRQSSGYKIKKEDLPNTLTKRRKASPAEVEEELEDEEDIKEEPPKGRLLKLMAPEWHYTTVGCISALIMGLSIPIYGIIFGEILESLNKPLAVAQSQTHVYCLVFLGMGVASAIAIFLQTFMFTISGESLTTRLREQLFKTMITQEIAFFDDPKNGTGALCSRLASDAAHVQGATGSRIATILQAGSTLITSIVIGLIYNYKIGLVVLAFVPLVLLATYFESKVVSGHLINEKKAFEDATSIAVEAIENIRTVASLHLERTFFNNYAASLLKPHKSSHKKSYTRGFSFGISQMMPNLAYAVAMYYGSVLINQKELTYGELFKITEGVILGTMMIGMAVAVAPDYQRAKVSALRIFRLLDRESAINPFSVEGQRPQGPVKGEVEFRNVHFRYPTRKNVQVLRGINFNISAGETVALVGSSGCGKSTCVQLLQRFYNSEKGETFVDSANIQQLNLAWLRSQIGIVSQEPVLFGYSIAENIAYGDNSRDVSMDEIIDAAKKANIHNFVTNLPLGYDTNVGDRGTQLSGGQKQRIAIARALVRNPQILLLDEATSALDTESEKVVQEALDAASEGRTCLVIAHRLSTVQNADKILVIHKGKVVEQGTHYELLAQEGFYNKLHSLQNGSSDE